MTALTIPELKEVREQVEKALARIEQHDARFAALEGVNEALTRIDQHDATREQRPWVDPVVFADWIRDEIKSHFVGVDPASLDVDLFARAVADRALQVLEGTYLILYTGNAKPEPITSQRDKLWRTLVRVYDVDPSPTEMCIRVVVPAWETTRIRIGFEKLPLWLVATAKGGARYYAKVNIGEPAEDQLRFEEWEPDRT